MIDQLPTCRSCNHKAEHEALCSSTDFASPGNRPWINGILDFQIERAGEHTETGLVKYSEDTQGRRRYTGTSSLKSSQVYPPGFGCAMARVFSQHKEELVRDDATRQRQVDTLMQYGDTRRLTTLLGQNFPDEQKGWLDAHLASVFRHLKTLSSAA